MSLPDGEYEIDLAALLADAPDTLAVKYGNVSADLDLTNTLTLYQTELEVIVKGSDRDNQALIFEGIGRGSGIASNASERLYYLSFGTNSVQLNRISDTLRVNKSRTVAKWSAKIAEWDPLRGVGRIRDGREQPRRDIKTDNGSKTNKIASKPVKIPSNPVKPFKPLILMSNTSKTASKRPPKEESPIISESDFEDLEDDDLAGFPQFSFPSTTAPTSTTAPMPPSTNRRAGKKPAKKPNKAAVNQTNSSNAASLSDDDFKDLEDQLQEVLDDDESDEDEGYTGSAIVIEGDKPVKGRAYGGFEGRTPISLHSFVGKRRGDDLSSEEE